jgi:hypothetical protein
LIATCGAIPRAFKPSTKGHGPSIHLNYMAEIIKLNDTD